MSDGYRYVQFTNSGELFASSFAAEWNGGETARTGELFNGASDTLDLTAYLVPSGASCWARAYIEAGPNHDSGGNFTFNPDSTATAYYTLTGSVDKPSFEGP